MSQTELKLRVTFATCALLGVGAVLAQLVARSGRIDWMLVAAMGASLCVSAAEALGLCRLAHSPLGRLVGAVLLGLATLIVLEG